MDMFSKYQTIGDTPQPRFGHTFTKVSPTKAVLFGGAIGEAGKFIITNQSYMYEINTRNWEKIECAGQLPYQRAAHGAVCVEDNQLIVYGGASSGGGGLCSDELFLLKINDESKWTLIPVQAPTPGKRYGHVLIYCKPYLVVIGGNTGATPVNDVWVLNIERIPYQWQNVNTGQLKPSPRVYHSGALCSVGSASGMIVIFGGRLADQNSSNETWGLRRHRDGRWDWVLAPYRNGQDLPICRYQHSIMFLGSLMIVSGGRTNNIDELYLPIEVYDTETSEWIKGVNFTRYRHASFLDDTSIIFHGGFEPDKPNLPLETLVGLDLSKIAAFASRIEKKNDEPIQERVIQTAQVKNTQEKILKEQRSITPLRLANKQQQEKSIKISDKVIVAQNYEEQDQKIIKKIPLINLQEEGKKLAIGFQELQISPIETQSEYFISFLLKKDWKHNDRFFIKKEQILKLCDEMIEVMIDQPSLVKLRVPIKIYGDLHGRFGDLHKLFQLFGIPSEEQGIGDIEKFNYLFLGNYVDFGFNSLEIICLLFSLKIKYKDQVCLLRGGHEDIRVNRIYGLAEECSIRLQDNVSDPDSVFQRINQVFDYLPLAGLIDNQVLCVHGGLGQGIKKIEQIIEIQRPLSVLVDFQNKDNQLAIDLMWSEYIKKDSDSLENKKKDIFNTNKFFNFNEKRLKGFIRENQISLIIRSNECISDGFEKNAEQTLITMCSYTDFQNIKKNQACMIKIKKNWELTPVVMNQGHQNQGPWIKISDIPFKNANIQFTEDEILIRKQFINQS